MNTPVADRLQIAFQAASKAIEGGDRSPKTALKLCRELAAGMALLEVRVEGVVEALGERGVDLGSEYSEIAEEMFRRIDADEESVI